MRSPAAVGTAFAGSFSVDLLRERLKAILDEVPEPVIVAERDSGALRLNAAARQLAGPSGKLELRRGSGEPFAAGESPLELALRTGHKIAGTEVLVRDAIGRELSFAATAVSAGDLVVAILQERGPLKSLERLRDTWLADVARILAQPIQLSLSGLERIRDIHGSGISEEERTELRRIQSLLEGLARLIADLEHFSRIDARHLELNRRETDLKSVIRLAVRRTAPLTEGRTVGVVFLGPLQSVVELDPQRIEHVVENLIANAVEYGDPGSPIEIAVRFEREHVRISVTNYGRGIAKEDLPRLFESRFTRSLRRKDSGLPGLGLGLFVTRGIVEAHGGTIRAESELGRKTVFTVTLPIRAARGRAA